MVACYQGVVDELEPHQVVEEDSSHYPIQSFHYCHSWGDHPRGAGQAET